MHLWGNLPPLHWQHPQLGGMPRRFTTQQPSSAAAPNSQLAWAGAGRGAAAWVQLRTLLLE